ncbi:MAG: hypothetical protein P8164_00770 [Gammaproteobacteria bacterium]
MMLNGNPTIMGNEKDIGKNFDDPLSMIFSNDGNDLAIPGNAKRPPVQS